MKIKKIKIVVIIITMIVMLLQFNYPVFAVSQSDIDEINQKVEEAQKEQEEIEKAQTEVAKQVADLTYQISEYQTEINQLEFKISDLNDQIEVKEIEIVKAEEEYEAQNELYEARLMAMYEMGETSYLDILLQSKDLLDFLSNYNLIKEIAENDTVMLEEIEKKRIEIETAKFELENSKKEIETSKVEIERYQLELETAKAEKDAYASQLSAEEKEVQAEIEQFEADKKAIEDELARIAAASKPAPEDNITNTPSASGYISPIAGGYITTGWYGYSGHTGVDYGYAGVNGKPILAVKSGTVVTSTALKYSNGTYRSYGEYIVIDHHDGTMTLYAHGAPGSRLVSVGQKVSQGQQIMSVGTTGNSSGPHLHFEVRVNGSPVNPTAYLP